jgi:hypothetical protein
MIYILSKEFNFSICKSFKNYFDKRGIQYKLYDIENKKINKKLYTKEEFKQLREYKKDFDKGILQHIGQNDIVTCWGWKRGIKYKEAGANVLLQEHGFVFNRNEWISLGWNGLNGKADFLNQNVSNDRWETFFKPHMKPWKKDGEYILLCGQVPGDASLEGRNLTDWYAKIAKKAKEYYKIPVIWRPHPVAVRTKKNISVPNTFLDTNSSLKDSLKKAKLLITYNSNSAVDAVMEGVPVIVYDSGSMVYEIANHKIGSLEYYDRSDWGRKIAYTQWHISEIASDVALDHIFQNYINTIK